MILKLGWRTQQGTNIVKSTKQKFSFSLKTVGRDFEVLVLAKSTIHNCTRDFSTGLESKKIMNYEFFSSNTVHNYTLVPTYSSPN